MKEMFKLKTNQKIKGLPDLRDRGLTVTKADIITGKKKKKTYDYIKLFVLQKNNKSEI